MLGGQPSLERLSAQFWPAPPWGGFQWALLPGRGSHGKHIKVGRMVGFPAPG